MPGYFDGFGRRGRFGIQTAPAPAMPYMDAPRTAPSLRPMDQGPTLAENPNMPGGYASSLRQAGVSPGYATKLALQRDRAQQGSMNTYTPRERADIYTAPMTGTAMFSPIRQGMDAMTRGINAGANYTEQMTAPMVQGQNYFNEAQNIQNQYAPGGYQADIDYRNAQVVGAQGDERRAQGVYDQTLPTLRPRAEAETGRIQAQTGQIGAETEAIHRDYQQKIRTYEDMNRGMRDELARQQAMIRSMQQQVNAAQRAAGQKETVWPDDGQLGQQQGSGQQPQGQDPTINRMDYKNGRDGNRAQSRETLPYDPRNPGGAQSRETLPMRVTGNGGNATAPQQYAKWNNDGSGLPIGPGTAIDQRAYEAMERSAPAMEKFQRDLRNRPGVVSAPVSNISSDAEYDALPSGTVFIGPDGKTRRKP